MNKKTLDKICSGLIPPDVGFDVKSVSFNMDLTKDFELEDDLISDMENSINSKAYKIMGELLPEDIRTKGYQMAEAYTYLYSVENSLRLFIEKVAKEKYGEAYFSRLTIPSCLQRIISGRQKNDESNKWLSVNGAVYVKEQIKRHGRRKNLCCFKLRKRKSNAILKTPVHLCLPLIVCYQTT